MDSYKGDTLYGMLWRHKGQALCRAAFNYGEFGHRSLFTRPHPSPENSVNSDFRDKVRDRQAEEAAVRDA